LNVKENYKRITFFMLDTYSYKAPTYDFGNKCGHDQKLPRLFERPAHWKKTYSIIHDATDNLKKYYSSPHEFLHKIRHNRYKTVNNEAVSLGVQRTESREIVSAVTGLLINYLDLESMSVYNKKDKYMSILDIATRLNVGYIRVWRALKILQKAGYVTFEHRSFYINQKYIPRIAIKRISEVLFTDLGVPRFRVQEERHHKRKPNRDDKSAVFNTENVSNQKTFKKQQSVGSVLCNLTKQNIKIDDKTPEQKRKDRYLKECAKFDKLLNDAISAIGFEKMKQNNITVDMLHKELNKKGYYHPDFPPPQ
jgi:hypothetical protein